MDIRLTEEQREILSGRICPYCLDPTQYEYVAFGEYPAVVIEGITDQTGYYGNIYRFCYCAAQMALEKMNPPDVTDTPGVRYAVTESDFW